MKYRTVVADFAWPLGLGGNVPSKMQGTALKETLPYRTMSVEDIRAFPINDYAAEDCLLFLWVTNGKTKTGIPVIQLALEILEHWGFTYHTMLTWVKDNPFSFWSPVKSATEHVILAHRGELNCDHVIFAYRGQFRELTSNKYSVMPGVFYAPNKTHSEKPAKFYQLVRSWTPGPRINLFARPAQIGFDGMGDEYVADGPLAPFLSEHGESSKIREQEECTE